MFHTPAHKNVAAPAAQVAIAPVPARRGNFPSTLAGICRAIEVNRHNDGGSDFSEAALRLALADRTGEILSLLTQVELLLFGRGRCTNQIVLGA